MCGLREPIPALVVSPILPEPPVTGGQKRTLRLLEAIERAGMHPRILTADLGVDLRMMLPGTSKVRATLDLGTLRPGAYSVWLTVTDPEGYLAPMNLAVGGARDGAYPLGKVRVARGRAH